jgi:hypothetical protein
MKKNKRIIPMVLLILLTIISLHSIAYAETVTAEKIVTSTDGSIDYILKGLNLEEGASYQWAIEKTQNETIENWYDVLNPDYASETIRISIVTTNQNQLSVLKSTDTGYLSIRKVGETNNILSNYRVDLTLPLLKTFTVEKNAWYGSAPTNPAYDVTAIYGINAKNISYTWEKITDANVVNNYIDNNHDLSGLPLKGKDSFPSLTDTSWKSITNNDTFNKSKGSMPYNQVPAEDGLYYLWIQASDTNVKTIQGQAIIEVGSVTKITETTDKKDENKDNPTGTTDDGKTTGKTDPTVANKILPNTGISMGIIGSILLVVVLGVAGLAKYYKYKDVK